MSDPRRVPDPARMQNRAPRQVIVPLTDLCRSPGGPRDRQLLMGAGVDVLREEGAWSYVQAQADGYCGHVLSNVLSAPLEATHRITAAGSHAYAQPDFKSRDLMALSVGSLLTVTDTTDFFVQTSIGYIPEQHVTALTEPESDPVSVAARLLGTPYLWGGNSRFGIDCSGLVQAACSLCDIPCPGDSDMQEDELGSLLPPSTPVARGDLLFWKGHVAMVFDSETLIHANAHAMATVLEPIEGAIQRITASDGPVTAHRRL